MFGASLDRKFVGYCVFEPVSGDITQVAVRRDYRRQGLATSLLIHALEFNQNEAVKCINTDTQCDSISPFFNPWELR